MAKDEPKVSNQKVTREYGVETIQALKGLEHVRLRPGMYIGDNAAKGLHHLVWEIVNNSVDEAMAGYCENIWVRINGDGSVSVTDDGRGMPVGMHPTEKRETVEVIMCELNAGGKFGGGGYKVSGGLHGVGASVVNALSEWVEVEVCRDGKVYQITFQRGQVAEKIKVVGKRAKNGHKSQAFKPDPEVFSTPTTITSGSFRAARARSPNEGAAFNIINTTGKTEESRYSKKGSCNS